MRGGSRTAATSKMERFVIIVNGWKPLTIITKRSILYVATVLDPPLHLSHPILTNSSCVMNNQLLKFINIQYLFHYLDDFFLQFSITVPLFSKKQDGRKF